MAQSHITRAITAIRGAIAPQEGEVVFDISCGVEGFGGWFTAAEAVRVILDNPRLEFKPACFWRL